MLEIKTKAPDFTLNDANGNTVSLSDFLGKKIVLYFYPKDNTPGCTKQACAFSSVYEDFKKKDVVIIGISKDSVASHKKFAEKYSLPFISLKKPQMHHAMFSGKNKSGLNVIKKLVIGLGVAVIPTSFAFALLSYDTTQKSQKQYIIEKNDIFFNLCGH